MQERLALQPIKGRNNNREKTQKKLVKQKTLEGVIHLIQVPCVEHEQRPLSSKDSPDSDHATARVMQLGPSQPLPSATLCQEGVLAQLVQAYSPPGRSQPPSIHTFQVHGLHNTWLVLAVATGVVTNVVVLASWHKLRQYVPVMTCAGEGWLFWFTASRRPSSTGVLTARCACNVTA